MTALTECPTFTDIVFNGAWPLAFALQEAFPDEDGFIYRQTAARLSHHELTVAAIPSLAAARPKATA